MKALVLDFDGVIADSAREVFTVTRRAYLELCPSSPLAGRDPEEIYEAFLGMMPLANRAEDYGVTLAILDEGLAIADQEVYDSFFATRDPRWLARYHSRFYEVRESIATGDPEGWLALNPPFGPVVDLLRRRAGQVTYAIATSKDSRSVHRLLRAYGIDDLFPSALVMDKEVGKRKSAHLRRLKEVLKLDFASMTFVDDKVRHLDSVAPLGVRCVLAGWGYNGPRQRELAASRGYRVCEKGSSLDIT